ncbi:MAG: hypothetical protein R2708_23735 [Vicinamibacterales bacterium]
MARDDTMLTLDEPDRQPGVTAGPPVPLDEATWLRRLFDTMRDEFDRPPVARFDPDRLYRRHGDPRD